MWIYYPVFTIINNTSGREEGLLRCEQAEVVPDARRLDSVDQQLCLVQLPQL
jgi:hypothetical protein